MKKEIQLLALVCALFSKPALSDNTKTTDARVSKATVFLRGAQLTCTSDFTAMPGINQFIFENVSANTDVNSLQASAKGSIVIMDVKFQTRYNEAVKKETPKQFDKALKLANDSLVALNFEVEELNDRLQSLITEKNILLSNKMIKGESLRDTLPMFKDGIQYLRERLINISSESISLKRKLHSKSELQQLLQERINTLSAVSQNGEQPAREAVNTIVVMAYSDVQTPAQISVSFFVNDAAWLPSYDLRANSDGTIDLNYKAELKQNTGMNWNNVALTLSTGNPSQSTQKPSLSPFYLSFIQKVKRQLDATKSTVTGATEINTTSKVFENKNDDMAEALSLANFTTENEGMIQTEYDIKLKYTIPNDDNLHVVAIQNKSLKAKYNYAVVPKLDVGSYLLAEIGDWSEMNLIPGASRIYFDGSYIGHSVLNPDASVDTLVLSLGKDRSILVNRKKLKDKTKERILLDEKTISVTYEISIRNSKSNAISLDVTDQVPVSSDPHIKVELLDNDHADYNTETGELSWKVSLKAKESKKLRFTYEVKNPKDKSLAGL